MAVVKSDNLRMADLKSNSVAGIRRSSWRNMNKKTTFDEVGCNAIAAGGEGGVRVVKVHSPQCKNSKFSFRAGDRVYFKSEVTARNEFQAAIEILSRSVVEEVVRLKNENKLTDDAFTELLCLILSKKISVEIEGMVEKSMEETLRHNLGII